MINFKPNMPVLQKLLQRRSDVVPQMQASKGGMMLPATQQYPGQWAGMSVEQWQQFNRDAWKTRGYTLPLEASISNDFTITLNGQAREFFGISFHAITSYNNDATMPVNVSLMVNTEQVIQETPWALLDQKYLTGMPFIPFRRMLSGSDNIKLSILNGALSQNVAVNWWYKSL